MMSSVKSCVSDSSPGKALRLIDFKQLDEVTVVQEESVESALKFGSPYW